MKNADCAPPGSYSGLYYFMLLLGERGSHRRRGEATSELAITPLAKIPPVGLGNRENTIDGSAIFRAIGHEASHCPRDGTRE